MKNLLTFNEYINEQAAPGSVGAGGGGVGYATLNSNGMGNIVAPTVGSTPGSVWGAGSGNIGSGDVSNNSFYNDKKFGLKIDKNKKRKDKKYKKKKIIRNNKVPMHFTKEYMSL